MNEPLSLHAFADTRRDEEVARPLLDDAGAYTLLDMPTRARLKDDGLDPLEMQKMRKHQAGRTGSDDSDLGTHGSWPRTRRSGLEEDGLVVALQADVEDVGSVSHRARDEGLARLGRNEGEDRVGGVCRLVLEVDAGKKPAQDAAREHPDIEMRRLHHAVRAGHAPRLHGVEGVASLRVALDPAKALEAGIREGGIGAGITPLAVRLPNLEHGVSDELPVAIDNAALDRDALAGGILRDEIVRGEVRDRITAGGRQGVREIGTRGLRRGEAGRARALRFSHDADLPSASRRGRAARCRNGSRAPIRARWSRCRTRTSCAGGPSRRECSSTSDRGQGADRPGNTSGSRGGSGTRARTARSGCAPGARRWGGSAKDRSPA